MLFVSFDGLLLLDRHLAKYNLESNFTLHLEAVVDMEEVIRNLLEAHSKCRDKVTINKKHNNFLNLITCLFILVLCLPIIMLTFCHDCTNFLILKIINYFMTVQTF